jgi:hypothetical protein
MVNSIGTGALGAGTTFGLSLTWSFVSAESILGDNS